MIKFLNDNLSVPASPQYSPYKINLENVPKFDRYKSFSLKAKTDSIECQHIGMSDV